MLNISILWEDSNLGYILQVALRMKAVSLQPSEMLFTASIMAARIPLRWIPISNSCWRINGTPVGVVDLNLSLDGRFFIKDHLGTYFYT